MAREDTLTRTSQAISGINLASLDYWQTANLEADFATLRSMAPVTWHEHPDSGRGFWSVVRHADIAEISNDPGTFSNAEGVRINHDADMNAVRPASGTMLELDPPDHTAYRKAFSKGFTPRAVARFEDLIRARVLSLIDGIADQGNCDFVESIAAPLPLHVICDIVGVPKGPARAKVFELADLSIAENDPDLGRGAAYGSDAALELKKYGEELATERRLEPRDDLLSELIGMQAQAGNALEGRRVSDLFSLLVAAGNETTRNTISHGMRAFTSFWDQREQLIQRPELAWRMAEEVVRWASPTLHQRRTVTRDVAFRGTRMRRGEKVAMWLFSGNRDESIFPEPERFDIARDPNRLQSFGAGGPHFCLGANLAKLEIVVLFQELFRALPDIRVVGDHVPVRSNLIRGIRQMEAVFSARPLPVQDAST